jgi:hypothetical protein
MSALTSLLKHPAVRPWLASVALFAVLAWGITWLIDVQEREQRGEGEEATAADTASPAVAVAPRDSEGGGRTVPIARILPLGPEDEGTRVVVSGEVVGEPTGEGFWVLTDDDEVIFARTATRAGSGDDVSVPGTLHQVPSATAAAWVSAAKLKEAAGWKVHHDLYLEGRERAPAGTPGAGVTDTTH